VIEGIEYVDLLAMAEADGARLKRISPTEYAGPCPKCGGVDRLHVLTKSRQGKPLWFCRNCHPDISDAADYVRIIRGRSAWADVFADLRRFGLPDNGRSSAVRQSAAIRFAALAPTSTVIAGVRVTHNDDDLDALFVPPAEQWQDEATIVSETARARLRTPAANAAAVYLYQRRHLLPATVERFRLGWLPASTTTGPMRWRAAIAGAIVMPWVFDGATCWKVQYRAVGDVEKKYRFQQKKNSYPAGRAHALPPFNGDAIKLAHTVLVTEGEMDCMLGQQCAPEGVAVVTWGGVGEKPNVWALGMLSGKRVFVAMDNDGPGAAAAPAWAELGELVKVPAGKDLGDYADLHGVDALRAWITEVTR